MEKIKVSVVVPIYNVELYLNRTMESLLKQTLKEIEIIMVDDESPDNCPAICDQYAKQYPNIKVIHKKNAGLGMACNSGIEVAIGEYIAFCDSDDYVDSEMYETMYNTAVQYNADAVFSGIKTVDQNGTVCPMNSYPCLQIIKERNDISNFAMDMIASKPSDSIERHIAMSAKIVLYRKEIIDKNNLRFVSERELISEDLIWNLDILCHSSSIVTLPQSYYYYYKNTNSLSKRIRIDRFKFFKSIREYLLYKQTAYYHLPQEAKQRIDRMFIGYCRSYIGNITNSTLPLKEKKQIVSEICTDKIWKEIWQTYPIFKMAKIHLLMLLLIKYNCYYSIYLMYKLKK
ncbi:glycosyltransferase [Phocaeicola plebeius]|jgi:glycosyltransferase involved in cell wall biosynthesis|uniref:Glycosyltransferase n=1 Tax=Phocaeicola plebeius TaxID=310297 RepID=A0A415TDN2_9BACT|nr:glycosyltransferase [Phocaeicola plebeius]RHM99319.1 glycosyltransferase [Phocaeicola plebeius]